MKIKLSMFWSLVLCFPALIWAVDPVPGSFPLVNMNHQEAVSATAINSANNLAFSGSINGVLKVWDRENLAIVQRLQISSDPIIAIAPNPVRDEVALVEEGSQGEYRLSVWNWREGRMSYSQTLEDLPLFAEYSPQGSFLMISLPQWRSLRFFDTQRARELPYLQDGFGIVNSAVINSSESRIMTYNSSNGSIRYLELSNGDQSHQTQTERGLEHLTLLANRRHALGYRSGRLYLVDVVNGSTLANTDVGQVQEIIPVDLDQNRFYAAVLSGSRHRLIPLQVSISGSSAQLSLRNSASIGISGESFAFSSDNGGGVFANANGSIASVDASGFHPMGQNSFRNIESVTLAGDWLFIQSSDSITRIPADLLQQNSSESFARAFQNTDPADISRISLPLVSPGGMVSEDGDSLYIWDREGTRGIWEIGPSGEQRAFLPISLRSPVRNIRIGQKYTLVLDSEDGMYLLDRESDEQVFSYQTLGLIDAIELPNGRILIGKNNSGFFQSSLIEVNPDTGETSVVNSSDTVVFGFSPIPSARGFYSIGISNSGSRAYTIVREYSNGNPNQDRVIMRFNGEDTEADIAYHQHTRSLASSAGLEGLSLYQSRRMQSLEQNNNLPRQLFSAGSGIFAINQDGSLSVWNDSNRRLVYNVLALPGGNLVVLNSDGSYAALETQAGSVNYDALLVPIVPSGSRVPVLRRISRTRSSSTSASNSSPTSQPAEAQEPEQNASDEQSDEGSVDGSIGSQNQENQDAEEHSAQESEPAEESADNSSQTDAAPQANG